jgi:16S rRNA (guanine966-N2)-methyltransferase
VRVVAGIAKGRPLRAPKGDATRPTSDFVREAIFNTLAGYLDLEGATVLDVFAGSGALGIEALSRGAAHATFVEHNHQATAAIRDNLDKTGFAAQATVLQADATKVHLAPADVAFADPPYAFDGWQTLLPRLQSGLVIVESDREVDPPRGWRVLKNKQYGSTVVTLTSPEAES